MRILLKPTLYRALAIFATVILIPEAILFFFLSVRRFLRFYESVRSDGPPHWYYLLFSFTMMIGVFLCISGCRLVWRREKEVRKRVFDESQPQRKKVRVSGKQVGAHLLLSFSFFFFAYFVPLVLYVVGKVFGREDTAEWIVGIPVGIACLCFLAMVLLRRRALKG